MSNKYKIWNVKKACLVLQAKMALLFLILQTFSFDAFGNSVVNIGDTGTLIINAQVRGQIFEGNPTLVLTGANKITLLLPDVIKLFNYEMTNVIASWARKHGYNGIIPPGARCAKDYENIIIFEQSYIDKGFSDITPQLILK